MNVFAAATGIGSWPGASPRRSARIIVGELHRLPYLPGTPRPRRRRRHDRPGRGAAGRHRHRHRAAGYRIASRPGAVTGGRPASSTRTSTPWRRRGRKPADPSPGVGEVQAPGHHPGRAVGAVQRASGDHRSGALARSDGVPGRGWPFIARSWRRLSAPVVVQFDEPVLAAALAGGGSSGVTALARCTRSTRPWRRPVGRTACAPRWDVRCCCTAAPQGTMEGVAAQRSVHAVSVDVGRSTPRASMVWGVRRLRTTPPCWAWCRVGSRSPAVGRGSGCRRGGGHRPGGIPAGRAGSADRDQSTMRAGRGHRGVGARSHRSVAARGDGDRRGPGCDLSHPFPPSERQSQTLCE